MELMVQQVVISALISIVSAHGEINEPNSVGLENMARMLRNDVRLITMGDSYSSPFYVRAPLSALRVWPIDKIAAISSGAPISAHTFICAPQCNPVSLIQASDSLGYTIERNTDSSFFTFPIFGVQEIYTSDSFDDEGDNRLFTFQQSGTGKDFLLTGLHGPFATTSDNLNFRFLYRCPSDSSQQVEYIKVFDYEEEVGTMQLRDGARPLWHLGENPAKGTRQAIPRHINASAQDFPANNSTGGLLKMRLKQVKPLAGLNQYFEPAGSVYYHVDEQGERKQGLYYNFIGDGSWSYTGFGCDTEGSGTLDKKFSLEQFTHWLDVTTLDREQPTLFMWFLAPEQLAYNSAFNKMVDMIDQADISAELVGLSSVNHLIVIAPLFDLTDDIELSKEYIRYQHEAAFDIANLRPNVSAASLFSATDEVLFDGVNAIPWLLYHGFDNFEFGSNSIDLIADTNGDLFDSWVVHPRSENAAAFFASILGEIIREAGCQGDVVADGLINTTDLLTIIGHFGEENVKEDLNGNGVVDLPDLLLVIDGWGDCWPVQAPYNTNAFRSN